VLFFNTHFLNKKDLKNFELFTSKQTNSLNADSMVSLADGLQIKNNKLLEKSV